MNIPKFIIISSFNGHLDGFQFCTNNRVPLYKLLVDIVRQFTKMATYSYIPTTIQKNSTVAIFLFLLILEGKYRDMYCYFPVFFLCLKDFKILKIYKNTKIKSNFREIFNKREKDYFILAPPSSSWAVDG